MSLLRMSLSGTILILFIILLRAAMMDRLPKKALPALWSVAILRLLLPVSLPMLQGIPAPAGGVSPVLDRMENGISDLAAGIFIGGQAGAGAGAAAGTEAAQITEAAAPGASVLPLIWLVGALLVAGSFLISWLRCRREFRTSLPVQNEFVDRWLSGHPLRRGLEIRSLTGLTVPLTYGLFRPVILMPKDTPWSDSPTLQYILYHEYLHIRRFDAVRKLAAAVTVCIHWFNPAVWALYLLYNRDMELVCDEGVLRKYGEADRAAYARALIDAAQQRNRFALYSSFAKNAVEERIKAIMKFRKTSVLAVAAAVVAVAVGVVGAFTVTPRSAKAMFRDILLGEREFLYVSRETAEPKTVSDIPALFDPDDDYMKIWDFAVQDLDGDGSTEVVLSVQGISGDTGGSLILHRMGNQVYGYKASNRDFSWLKADSTYLYSDPSGAVEGGICSITGFTETGCTTEKITYGRGPVVGWDTFVVDYQPATDKEYFAAINIQNNKPDAVWYEFSEENIRAVF